MSRNSKFYLSSQSQSEIDTEFLKVRNKVASKYNIDGKKIFMSKQKTNENGICYPDGKYIVINESHMNLEDYWYENLEADILLLSSKFKKIIVGHQMSDCPILIIEDRKKGITAISHCGATYIDRNLPEQTIYALQNEYNSEIKDLYAYIGSHIKKDSYIYETYPNWAKNKIVWKNNIIKTNNKYHIDLTSAIVEQLKKNKIEHIEISDNDTYLNPNYYSHYAEIRGNKRKKGQNFVGFFYK